MIEWSILHVLMCLCTSSPYTPGRRKSVAPQEFNKGNKRLSCVVKPSDMQTKKGKVWCFYSFYCFCFFSSGLVSTSRHKRSSISHFIYISFLSVWRTFTTKPEVLWYDSRVQRDLGNNSYINFWHCKFRLKNNLPCIKPYASMQCI